MLTKEQLNFYAHNGYLLLDGVFTPEEIEECSQEYDQLFQSKQNISNLEATWKGGWTASSPDALKVLSIHNLQCHGGVFTRMLLNKTLVDAVSELVGSPNILLHHTKAHIKPPGVGAPFPTHQDYHYFPFKNDSMVAVFIHLDDSDIENGGLAVFPGSHKLGPQENASDVSTHFYVSQTKFPLESATPLIAKKGQVVIFSYLLVHGSYQNTSDRMRRMLLFQLFHTDLGRCALIGPTSGKASLTTLPVIRKVKEVTTAYQCNRSTLQPFNHCDLRSVTEEGGCSYEL